MAEDTPAAGWAEPTEIVDESKAKPELPGASWTVPTAPPGSGALRDYDPEAGVVRLMGDPMLRSRSKEVDPTSEEAKEGRRVLQASLRAFRSKFGFGRGISAVQVGVPLRMIALNLDGKHAFTIHNAEITWRSDETFTLYDDCMSFPDLLVRVRRHKSISISYLDEEGNKQEMNKVSDAVSELLQHEIDHMDGVLSVDRAIGPDGVVYRDVYEANKEHFDAMVDYSIEPTIATDDGAEAADE